MVYDKSDKSDKMEKLERRMEELGEQAARYKEERNEARRQVETLKRRLPISPLDDSNQGREGETGMQVGRERTVSVCGTVPGWEGGTFPSQCGTNENPGSVHIVVVPNLGTPPQNASWARDQTLR